MAAKLDRFDRKYRRQDLAWERSTRKKTFVPPSQMARLASQERQRPKRRSALHVARCNRCAFTSQLGNPMRQIMAHHKKKHPGVRYAGFSRGLNAVQHKHYTQRLRHPQRRPTVAVKRRRKRR
jgi:hypothetical protein